MNKSSTLILRKIIGKRFNISPHLVKAEDISILMKYFTLYDMKDFHEEEMSAFLANVAIEKMQPLNGREKHLRMLN